MKFSTCNCSST